MLFLKKIFEARVGANWYAGRYADFLTKNQQVPGLACRMIYRWNCSFHLEAVAQPLQCLSHHIGKIWLPLMEYYFSKFLKLCESAFFRKHPENWLSGSFSTTLPSLPNLALMLFSVLQADWYQSLLWFHERTGHSSTLFPAPFRHVSRWKLPFHCPLRIGWCSRNSAITLFVWYWQHRPGWIRKTWIRKTCHLSQYLPDFHPCVLSCRHIFPWSISPISGFWTVRIASWWLYRTPARWFLHWLQIQPVYVECYKLPWLHPCSSRCFAEWSAVFPEYPYRFIYCSRNSCFVSQ